MLLNENEAREKWCHATLRGKASRCLASQCMAWHWAEYIPQVCEKCEDAEAEWIEAPEQRRGYCGLAGISKF